MIFSIDIFRKHDLLVSQGSILELHYLGEVKNFCSCIIYDKFI